MPCPQLALSGMHDPNQHSRESSAQPSVLPIIRRQLHVCTKPGLSILWRSCHPLPITHFHARYCTLPHATSPCCFPAPLKLNEVFFAASKTLHKQEGNHQRGSWANPSLMCHHKHRLNKLMKQMGSKAMVDTCPSGRAEVLAKTALRHFAQTLMSQTRRSVAREQHF